MIETTSKKVKLTDRYLKTMTVPVEGRIKVYDTEMPGLRIRHYPSGKMS
jgi:hypothetical protein